MVVPGKDKIALAVLDSVMSIADNQKLGNHSQSGEWQWLKQA